MKSMLFFLLSSLWTYNVVAENFTFTYTMAMRCKEHLCQHGYSYETFYQVDNVDRRPKTDGAVFEMHLAILAASNGHILLSTVPHPEPRDPVYEIVVGGGANKFTELRRNLRRNARSSAKTVGILSPIEFRAFYIRISEDGVIEFGREGDQLPLLSYTDVNPLTIKYFSFAAWNGVEAKFLYDCPPPGANAAEVSPDSKEVEQKLSNSDELKRTLLTDRLPNLPPSSVVEVKLDVRITGVHYDAYSSKLVTGMAIVALWNDNSMAWFPDKFNGTQTLKFFQGQIWRPTFFVFNSHDMGVLDNKNPDLITMNYTGEASFHYRTKTYTWCYEIDTINRWPNDEYSCTILIGAWEPHERITLKELAEDSPIVKMYANVDEVIRNEWEIGTKIGVVPMSVWSKIFPPMDNQTHQSDKLLINLNLKRRGTSLNLTFHIPLFVLLTFVLLSFWTEPLKMSRVWFYTGCIIVSAMELCYADYLVPCHSIPTIMILYTAILMGVIIALLTQVVLMTSTVEKLCKTMMMQNLLTAKLLRTIFCLPVMKSCKNYESFNEGYSQEDDDSGVMIAPRNGPVEEMQTDNTKYGEREELAEVLDKLLFSVYSITFAIMFALHY